MLQFNLEDYNSDYAQCKMNPAHRPASMYNNIPIEFRYNKDVLSLIKRRRLNVRYRGPRHGNTHDTPKQYATGFSLYPS